MIKFGQATLAACYLAVTGVIAGASTSDPFAGAAVARPDGEPVHFTFENPALPIQARVSDLVARMTLQEKVSQMMHAAPAIPRLGIPAYNWWSEGLHGVAASGYATVFPQAIGLAASFDPDLLHTEAGYIATEFRAKYNEELQAKGYTSWFRGLTVWSPNINIFRDPRWGRGQETYGEDPFLTAQMGVALVTGLQGDDPRYLDVLSTPKHFAVHSGPESTRHSADVQISNHDLEDTYLPAFRATVLAGAGSVMCAYNSINGKPACAQPLLLQKHLRDAWDFNGYVVSDCGAASDIARNHHYAATLPAGMAAAVKAGMDIICTWPEAAIATESAALLDAVREGLLAEPDIDRSVRRLFTARMRLGMFDPPARVPFSNISIAQNDTEPHRQLALQAARESLVLLQNRRHLLPLQGRYRNIAVVGPNADSVSALLGNYNGTPSNPVTVLAGIRARFPAASVVSAQGSSLIGPPLTPVPEKYLHSDSAAQGLSAEYFKGRALAGAPVIKRIDAGVDFTWRHGVSSELMSDFSVRWSGSLVPSATGEYTIGFNGTDRFRAWFDGALLGEADFAGNGRTVSRSVHLESGHAYPVKIEFAQEHNTGHAALVWHATDTGPDYVAAVQRADLIVAVLGLTSELEGEEMPVSIPGFVGGDRTRLELPAAQQKLLEELVATGKPVVLVLMNGSALAVNWADKHAAAILEAWYPGEAGGRAVAEALAGDFSPSGRLPVTFYKSLEQLPPFDNYAMQGRTYRYFHGDPLYPFGYGLSYTSFAFSNLSFDRNELGANDDLTATVKVTNTGKMASDEVVQFYVAHPGVESAPVRSLAGMQRIRLDPGETRSVSVQLPNRSLSVVGPDGVRRILPGNLSLWAGNGQPDTRTALQPTAGVAGSIAIRGGAVLPE